MKTDSTTIDKEVLEAFQMETKRSWKAANNARKLLARNNNNDFREQIIGTARASGYCGIWMIVFQDDDDMCRRLIRTFLLDKKTYDMTTEEHKTNKEICKECDYFKVSTAPIFAINHTKVCMNSRSDHCGHVLYLSHPACIRFRFRPKNTKRRGSG